MATLSKRRDDGPDAAWPLCRSLTEHLLCLGMLSNKDIFNWGQASRSLHAAAAQAPLPSAVELANKRPSKGKISWLKSNLHRITNVSVLLSTSTDQNSKPAPGEYAAEVLGLLSAASGLKKLTLAYDSTSYYFTSTAFKVPELQLCLLSRLQALQLNFLPQHTLPEQLFPSLRS